MNSRRPAESPLAPFLEAGVPMLLDGGLATALEARGHVLATRLWSAGLLSEAPEEIRAVHTEYLEAGAECIISASYQASFRGFEEVGRSAADAASCLALSSRLAVEARDAFHSARSTVMGTEGSTVTDATLATPSPLVAASIGPYGAYRADGSEYVGRYGIDDDELTDFHRRRFRLLAGSGVDLLACETIPSQQEAGVLLHLLEAEEAAWAWFSFCCRDGAHLADGTRMEDAVSACAGVAGVAAVGVNCTDPRHVPELVTRARSVTDLPVVAYPNSGERYHAGSGGWSAPLDGDADDRWLRGVLAAVEAGASLVGGCCRTGPGDIRRLRKALRGGH